MIELPEAVVLSREINDTLTGKRILHVTAAHSPHKFAWYHEDPHNYHNLLVNKIISGAVNKGGLVEIKADHTKILISEGVRLRYFTEGEVLPAKHQLHIQFEDHSSLVGSVQMYGGLCAFSEGDYDNEYYRAAIQKPSPLAEDFTSTYFERLLAESPDKLSVKGFLATEQRIPGLGNGVLQDILFNAKLHPKRKINTLDDKERKMLFDSIKVTLSNMTKNGGRDTEQDLFGYAGGYKTLCCKNTVNYPCPNCGSPIQKQAYMGGSVYFCEKCQKM